MEDDDSGRTVRTVHDYHVTAHPDRDPIDQLAKLAQLHEEGVLTKGEFDQAKKRLGFGDDTAGVGGLVVAGAIAVALLAFVTK